MPSRALAEARPRGRTARGQSSTLRLFVDDLHRDGDQTVQLLIRRFREQRFRPRVVVALGVAIEQAANERDERDALEIRATLADRGFLLILEQRLEAMRV